jgi:hypothetical protein
MARRTARLLEILIFDERDGPFRPTRRDLTVFSGWLLAAAVYIAIGLYEVDFLLSFWVAAAYVVVAAWLVPAVVRRLL